MKLEVKVKQKYIVHSQIRSTTDCPIAHALKDQHPRDGLWMVWMDRVALWPGPSYPLPKEATEFIMDMLDNKPVLPFTFILEV